MRRPTKRVLENGFPVTGKVCTIRAQHATTEGGEPVGVGEEYALFCDGHLIAVGDANRLSEWALYEGGAKEVTHDYDLREYDNRYRGDAGLS